MLRTENIHAHGHTAKCPLAASKIFSRTWLTGLIMMWRKTSSSTCRRHPLNASQQEKYIMREKINALWVQHSFTTSINWKHENEMERYTHTLSRGCKNTLRHTAASSWRRTMALWQFYITLSHFKCGSRCNDTVLLNKTHNKTERFHDDHAIVGKLVNYLDFASLCRFNNLTCQMGPNPSAFKVHPSLKEKKKKHHKKNRLNWFLQKENPDGNSSACGELQCAASSNKNICQSRSGVKRKHEKSPRWRSLFSFDVKMQVFSDISCVF